MNDYSIVLDFANLASYIILAVSLYSIAKRRGIRRPWLAWIPVANIWMLGCISDQYRYVARGEERSKRKKLLTLEIIMIVLLVAVIVFVASCFFELASVIDVDPKYLLELAEMDEEELTQALTELFQTTFENNGAMLPQMMRSLLVAGVLCLVLTVVAVALSVIQYMAYYDIFMSCEPRNAGTFLTLGIIASFMGFGLLLSLFVAICRNKDLGMPPRKDEVPVQPPVWLPPEQPM